MIRALEPATRGPHAPARRRGARHRRRRRGAGLQRPRQRASSRRGSTTASGRGACRSPTAGGSREGGGVNLLSAGRETDMGHGAAFHDNVVEVEARLRPQALFTLDLDRCTGCSACAVACTIENVVDAPDRLAPHPHLQRADVSPDAASSTSRWPATTASSRPAWTAARPTPTARTRRPAPCCSTATAASAAATAPGSVPTTHRSSTRQRESWRSAPSARTGSPRGWNRPVSRLVRSMPWGSSSEAHLTVRARRGFLMWDSSRRSVSSQGEGGLRRPR